MKREMGSHFKWRNCLEVGGRSCLVNESREIKVIWDQTWRVLKATGKEPYRKMINGFFGSRSITRGQKDFSGR